MLAGRYSGRPERARCLSRWTGGCSGQCSGCAGCGPCPSTRASQPALLGPQPGGGARSAPPTGLTAVATALRSTAWRTEAHVHRVGEDVRCGRTNALARASGTLGSSAAPTSGTGRIPTRSTRRSRRSSRSVGRAGPRSTRSAGLIGRDRDQDLPVIRVPGRSTRTSRVPVGGGCPQPAARTPARSGRRPPGGLSDALEPLLPEAARRLCGRRRRSREHSAPSRWWRCPARLPRRTRPVPSSTRDTHRPRPVCTNQPATSPSTYRPPSNRIGWCNGPASPGIRTGRTAPSRSPLRTGRVRRCCDSYIKLAGVLGILIVGNLPLCDPIQEFSNERT